MTTIKKRAILITKGYKPTKSKAWNDHASTLASYYQQQRELATKIELAKEKLEKMCKGENIVGKDYYLHQVTRKGSVNYKAIPVLKEMDLTPYMGSDVTYWKLEEL